MTLFDVASIWKAPKGGVCFSIQMEDFLDRNGDRRVVGIHFHDVGHHVPPFLRDGIYVACVLTVGVAGAFLIAEEDVSVLVPINAVVAHTGILDHFHQFGPNGGMAAGILFLTSWLEEHLEGKSFHKQCCWSMRPQRYD